MKTPSISLLNSIGFRNASDKALYAAHLLKVASVSSPAVTISPMVPAVPAKPAIIAQTAKPARPASPAVLGAENTTGYAFGAIYLNSPAYPIGTPIPAIPAKPASLAVVGVHAVVAVAAIPAVVAPAIIAIKGWEDAITITKTVSSIQIVAYLPCASSPLLIGSPTSGIDAIGEMSPPALQPTAWLDTKSSTTPGTAIAEPATVEKYLYKQALALVAAPASTSTIQNASKVINGVTTACKKLTLNLAATGYILGVDSLQLGKLV